MLKCDFYLFFPVSRYVGSSGQFTRFWKSFIETTWTVNEKDRERVPTIFAPLSILDQEYINENMTLHNCKVLLFRVWCSLGFSLKHHIILKQTLHGCVCVPCVQIQYLLFCIEFQFWTAGKFTFLFVCLGWVNNQPQAPDLI